jgi:predicted porin
MKRSIVCIAISMFAAVVNAESGLTIGGELKVAGTYGNGGTTPIDGATADHWALNDLSSVLRFSGHEDLEDGLYGGFDLVSFLRVNNGTTWSDNPRPLVGNAAAQGGPFWSSKAVVKFGGSFGEFYAGRALTPQEWMVLFSDPWYWDGSAAQMGWQIQRANYTSTSYIRTNNTIGYTSPKINGLQVIVAGAAGEGQVSKDIGGSVTYDKGPVWVGLAYDQSHGYFNDPTQDHVVTLVGAYDFGAVRPLLSYSSSKVNGVSYSGYTVAATAPLGAKGLLKAAYGHLNDFDTSTPAKEALTKLSIGYQYNVSKRSNLFIQFANDKAATRTATQTAEMGVDYSF